MHIIIHTLPSHWSCWSVLEPVINSPTGEPSAIVLACIINPRKSVLVAPPESTTMCVCNHKQLSTYTAS